MLLALLCVCGLGVVLMNKEKPKPTVGILEFSSDDPTIRAVLEKDGLETPLEPLPKLTVQLEPGKYNVRLEGSPQGVKLQPNWFNLDAGGRAFVTVRRLPKEDPESDPLPAKDKMSTPEKSSTPEKKK